VFSSPKGRGKQLIAGALQATGDVLLFLHADSSLPPGYLSASNNNNNNNNTNTNNNNTDNSNTYNNNSKYAYAGTTE
jgi:hypothetical protein